MFLPSTNSISCLSQSDCASPLFESLILFCVFCTACERHTVNATKNEINIKESAKRWRRQSEKRSKRNQVTLTISISHFGLTAKPRNWIHLKFFDRLNERIRWVPMTLDLLKVFLNCRAVSVAREVSAALDALPMTDHFAICACELKMSQFFV